MKVLEESLLNFKLYSKKDLWDEQSILIHKVEEVTNRHPNKRWYKEDLCTEVKKMVRLIKIVGKKMYFRGFE